MIRDRSDWGKVDYRDIGEDLFLGGLIDGKEYLISI